MPAHKARHLQAEKYEKKGVSVLLLVGIGMEKVLLLRSVSLSFFFRNSWFSYRGIPTCKILLLRRT